MDDASWFHTLDAQERSADFDVFRIWWFVRFYGFPRFYGFYVFLKISCIYIDFDKFLKIWLAGWLLVAGGMVRRRGSKVVPHARRSGEVGGLSV